MFFFILPVGVDYRAKRYPVVTFTLMGLCTVIWLITFLLRLGNGEAVDDWVFTHLWLTPAESPWWTWITSMFVHEGFFHLAGNMVYLFLFGSCVEDTIGRIHYAVFFVLGGIAAELVHVAASPAHFGSMLPLGGASGAVSACIGGFVLLYFRTKIEFKWVFFFFLRFFSGDFFLPAWLVISFWFGSDLLGAVATMLQDREGGGVAFAAHVGGTLFGLGFMALEKLWLQRAARQEEAGERQALLAAREQRAEDETGAFHLLMGETQLGPLNRRTIREMLALGSIPDDALFWAEGMGDWRSVEELRALLG